MSNSKGAGGASSIYGQFLHGAFNNNNVINRTLMMERMYQRLLTELAVNRFKWFNMPESVDVRFMELTLFYNALSVFYFDKEYGKHFALRGGGINWVNMMDNPVGFTVVGNGPFRGKQLSAVNETKSGGVAVPIWSNALRMPDLDIVSIYAYRLARIDRTIEINSDNARQSKTLVSGEKQRLSIKNFDKQYDEGTNNITVAGPLQDLAFMQALDLGVDPKSHEALHVLKVRQWNECMGYLGIDNANQDKKERLVAGEVEANDAQSSMMRFVNLQERQRSIAKANKIYPDAATNEDDNSGMRVEYNTEVEKRAQQIFETALAIEADNALADDEPSEDD